MADKIQKLGTRMFFLSEPVIATRKHYGFFHLLWDLFFVCASGGLWLIWLLIKFLRNGRV